MDQQNQEQVNLMVVLNDLQRQLSDKCLELSIANARIQALTQTKEESKSTES